MEKAIENLWEPVSIKDRHAESNIEDKLPRIKGFYMRFKTNKKAVAGVAMLFFIALFALVGPKLTEYSYLQQNLMNTNQPPNMAHWFGTDGVGRDLFIRVLYGARVSLVVGILSACIVCVLGCIYGGLSGYFGGLLDRIMMQIINIIGTIPLVLYVILLSLILKPGITTMVIAIGSIYWIPMARIVRSQIISLKEQEFIYASKALGAGSLRIITKHLLPNILGTIIVTTTLVIPEAIFIESFLSFIGVGVEIPKASWGVLVYDAIGGIRSYPYQLFFPSLGICITIIGFNLLGDGLRDILDIKKVNWRRI
ncbi:MAG: ABC transporter permease [Clostridia bacterium]|nr:ABC transporter permease [Clostridia bacterium]